RLAADARRAGQPHAGAGLAGLPAGHHLDRARPRGGDQPVPVPIPAGRRTVVPEHPQEARARHMSAAVLDSRALASRSRRRLRRRHVAASVGTYVGVGLFVLFAIFPVYWMFIATFKQNSDLYSISNNPFWFNIPATWDNVAYLFEKTQFVRWCINTLEI